MVQTCYISVWVYFSHLWFTIILLHRLICAKIIPISKGSKPALTCPSKYRSIPISNVIGKILDHVIIDRQLECLKTCDYQFGFKQKASTVLCSTMVNETIQYFTGYGVNPVSLLLLDAIKTFDKSLI